MDHLERAASIVGVLLIGVAAYLVVLDKRERNARRRSSPPVEELGENLKQAWAGYHNR